MVYSDITSTITGDRTTTEYVYDAYGRRTLVQDAGGQTVRTLYDEKSFEVIREGVTFTDGTFTTKYSTEAIHTTNPGTAGRRYRWLESGTEDARTRSETTSTSSARYTGSTVTLYGRGEAVGMSLSATTETRGGMKYLGKDILGSVRSTTDEYGTLEDRYNAASPQRCKNQYLSLPTRRG